MGCIDGDGYECNDTIATNTGAFVATLPVAVIGQCVTFYHLTAGNYVVNPNGIERILTLTDANGDSILSATVGDSIELCAIAASQWAAVARVGTWSDNN